MIGQVYYYIVERLLVILRRFDLIQYLFNCETAIVKGVLFACQLYLRLYSSIFSKIVIGIQEFHAIPYMTEY